ncbi:MAG TPA: glycosyltransferase family 2 protein [Nitrospira sp.]|nr:glycosyltransferase family 2 protein [Nitrospira sp.]HMU30824.1 glycosyltransferase family 2 protein [Nitrospira sp.]HMW84369.1 glycosyltransferase family 2 protein [Nitrospira sp.]HMX92479.1 glycosyltransferase family 2 protein [Nitrospira sp.]HMZ95921.1 glycosyltransferase family 2 protein [Nitrospira sp.]
MSFTNSQAETPWVSGPFFHTYPIVSIIIPCRNERAFIAGCLESVLANDFPKDRLEILVVDGLSDDGTREILDGFSRDHAFLSVLDNPKRVTPAALNLGIKHTRGPIVMRMDAHARYDSHYISRCVDALGKYKVDNVGGIWKTLPRTETLAGWGVVKALSHPFGVGNSHFRLPQGSEPKFVDTVPFFCVRRWVFQELGGFNESLVRGEDMEFSLRLNQPGVFNERLTRGQDMEFSLRLRKAGGRTLLIPDIVSYYYARSDIKSFWCHNWINGVWAILPFAYSNVIPVSLRHLVPLFFVGSLVSTLVLTAWQGTFGWMFAGILGAYLLANVVASLHVAWEARQPQYAVLMPIIFAMLHVGYGLGSLWGVVRLLTIREFWQKIFNVETNRAAPAR